MMDGSDSIESKEFWYQQLKSRGTDEESGFGTKGSFLELTFTCRLMRKGVLLSIVLGVCGIPSDN